MKLAAVSLVSWVALLLATTPATAQCTDTDGDHFYAQSGCGTAQDCDDANATVYPGAPTLCDGVRNDCNDLPCEGGGPEDCDQDTDGFTPCDGDCDDTNPFASPGAAQACDGANNDCNDPHWPSVPGAEIDDDGDDYPTCTGSCEVRVTTDAALPSVFAGPSSSRSIVATDDGFVVAYKQFPSGGLKRIRTLRLDTWGRKIAGPVEVEILGSSGGPGNPIVAKATVGFGIAWEARPSIRFQLLGEDLAPLGSPVLIDNGCHDTDFADLQGVVWTGLEFGVVWNKLSCDGHWSTYLSRVGTDGLEIGAPTTLVDSYALGSIVWNGAGHGFAWLGGDGSIFFERFTSSGVPDGAPVAVASAIDSGERPAIVWTGDAYAVAWSARASGDLEIHLARFDANGQRLGADTRVSNAPGNSVGPRLVWSGEDYGVSWLDFRDGSAQVYFSRIAASGEVIEPNRRISFAPRSANSLAAASSESQTIMIYSVATETDPDAEIFAARESCRDCDDADPATYPGAPETCDGRNNDCRDPSWPTVPDDEADADGDQLRHCSGDCDDHDAATYPGALQVCDGLNNDCLDANWPTPPPDDRDADGDGGSVCQGDCNDSNAAVHPGATEICNAIDDNCDGRTDEDALGVDSDNDTVHNACDNCPLSANAHQDDFDGDRVGDACDDCVFDWNATQADFDHDDEGDLCDVNDGLIYVYSADRNYREWQAESGYTTWNSYRGSLSVLRTSGLYTQAAGSNPIATHDCGLGETYVFDDYLPGAGAVAFNLVTGIAGGVESSLGTNSAGVPRPNANPCP